MSSGAPIRTPNPYDIKINGNGFMMPTPRGKRQPAVINLEHPDPLQGAAPVDYNYSGQNPTLEATSVYDNFTGGFGQKFQHHRYEDKKYFYASHMDLSIDGQMMLGPYIRSVTPNGSLDTSNGIVKFFEIGGSLYALNGRYVLKRTADTAAGWGTVSIDFGGGKAGLDVMVHKQNTGSSTTYAYVAMGDSEFMYRFDGTTWTQHASLYARAFAEVGKEVYRANGTNQLSKLAQNADPWTAANWSSSTTYYVGDNSSAINRLVVDSAGVLLVLKTNGVYVLDRDGNDIDLTSDMKLAPDATNGFWSWRFENFTHITLNGRHFRLSPGPYFQIEPIGPERYTENDSPVHGYVTAGVGTAFAAYAGIYNPDSGHSYLAKFGGYAKNDDGSPHRLAVWHASLSGVAVGSDTTTFSSRKITSMIRTPNAGAPSGHEQLYIGCSDGTIHDFTLPCAPNPTACSSYNFHAASTQQLGYIVMPSFNGGFAKDEKVIRAVTVVGPKLGSTNGVTRMLYRTSGSSSGYSAIGTTSLDTTSIGASSPATRYPVDVTVTLEDLAFEFLASSGAAQTVTPVASGIALHYRVNAPIQLVCDIPILAENGMLKRDGSLMRIGADQIRSLLRTACATTAGVAVVFPHELTLTMQLSHYREAIMWDQSTKQYRAVVIVRATQSDAGATDTSGGIHQLS